MWLLTLCRSAIRSYRNLLEILLQTLSAILFIVLSISFFHKEQFLQSERGGTPLHATVRENCDLMLNDMIQ